MKTELAGLSKVITQDNINLYARASRDFNPIHIDEAFARQTPLGGTIAHGMSVLAFISEMMTAAYGQGWITTGRLNVRFRAPARPGDAITVTGKLRKTAAGEGETVVTYDVLCANQKGEAVITGEASVKVKQ